MLKTKSIQMPRDESDGIRICIMRKLPKESTWDLCMQSLAPSLELLASYHQETIDWNTYAKRFDEEVILAQQADLKKLIALSHDTIVTILCWETAPDKCHRRLVAEACKKINPYLELTIL